MNLPDRISIDPQICHGAVCIKGTRIPVSVILDNLAAGIPPERIITSYPPLVVEDTQAAVAYAAALVKGQYVPIEIETGT